MYTYTMRIGVVASAVHPFSHVTLVFGAGPLC